MNQRENGQDDRGDVAILVASLVSVVGMLLMLIVQAGALLTARTQADTLAAEAARVAALSSVAQSNLSQTINQAQGNQAQGNQAQGKADPFASASTAVDLYIAEVNKVSPQLQATHSIQHSGPNSMQVTVTVSSRPVLGTAYRRSASRGATVETGINQPDGRGAAPAQPTRPPATATPSVKPKPSDTAKPSAEPEPTPSVKPKPSESPNPTNATPSAGGTP